MLCAAAMIAQQVGAKATRRRDRREACQDARMPEGGKGDEFCEKYRTSTDPVEKERIAAESRAYCESVCAGPHVMAAGEADNDPGIDVLMDQFIKGDVYIDYPPEDVKFRFEHATRRVFRRFYGEAEREMAPDSNLYHEAISAGKQITRDEYYKN
jgi:hypothetical protein